ncbi:MULTISPECIES: hypothetical protein [Nocardioides]|uniref:Uncharacterized protein n=1 Tax=Nocardioides vastitatis TaxID=2568655 RepID=A0ABW0ZK12_9ACTN|nr:hypothetical protein [Nocardioides sp.]THJ10611.1 hypothetical protein E7Z54_02660 [Nocardioides sp.]
MPPTVLPARLRRGGIALGVLTALGVLLLSHTFGRAVPTNSYRPLITADAIASGCYPLPGDAQLDGLSYQVRWDEDLETSEGERRELRGQYNLVDRAEAERRLVDSFTAVGFREAPETGAGGQRVLRRGAATVGITVTDLPDTSEDTLVRGEFVLDLPVAQLAKDDPVCSLPASTKRWAEER